MLIVTAWKGTNKGNFGCQELEQPGEAAEFPVQPLPGQKSREDTVWDVHQELSPHSKAIPRGGKGQWSAGIGEFDSRAKQKVPFGVKNGLKGF